MRIKALLCPDPLKEFLSLNHSLVESGEDLSLSGNFTISEEELRDCLHADCNLDYKGLIFQYPGRKEKEVKVDGWTKVCLFGFWKSSEDIRKEWTGRMCPGGKTFWGSLLVISDPHEAEYHVLISSPMPQEAHLVQYHKVISIQSEPSAYWNFTFPFSLERNNWEWLTNQPFDHILNHHPKKSKELSIIVSSMRNCPGHLKRLAFLESLLKEVELDFYGRGHNPNTPKYLGELKNKEDGLEPYRYTIALENAREPGYITEKIIDGILNESVVFYCGAPNVKEFIDPACFIELDLENPSASIELIKEGIKSGEWEKRIDRIRQEKGRILSQEAFFPKLKSLIEKRKEKEEKATEWESIYAETVEQGIEVFSRSPQATAIICLNGVSLRKGIYKELLNLPKGVGKVLLDSPFPFSQLRGVKHLGHNFFEAKGEESACFWISKEKGSTAFIYPPAARKDGALALARAVSLRQGRRYKESFSLLRELEQYLPVPAGVWSEYLVSSFYCGAKEYGRRAIEQMVSILRQGKSPELSKISETILHDAGFYAHPRALKELKELFEVKVPCFVITIDSKRKERMRGRMERLGLPFSFVEGVKITEEWKGKYKRPGAIACLQAHLKAYKTFLEDKRYEQDKGALFFEDDALMHKDFTKVLRTLDLEVPYLLFSPIVWAQHKRHQVSDNLYWIGKYVASAACYWMSRGMMLSLVSKFSVPVEKYPPHYLEKPIDDILNDEGMGFFYYPPLAVEDGLSSFVDNTEVNERFLGVWWQFDYLNYLPDKGEEDAEIYYNLTAAYLAKGELSKAKTTFQALARKGEEKLSRKAAISLVKSGNKELAVLALEYFKSRKEIPEEVENLVGAYGIPLQLQERKAGRLFFASFGNEEYELALQRILKQAQEFPFSQIRGYRPKDLDPSFLLKHQAFLKGRGYGYWIWKAQVVKQAFQDMQEGDILTYLDSGCHLIKSGIPRFLEYVDMVTRDETGSLGFMQLCLDREWTKADISKEVYDFSLYPDKGQPLGGIFLLRKGKKAERLVEEWSSLSQVYRLIDDSPSLSPNPKEFKENRHDQSLFSAIRKKYGTLFIKDETGDFNLLTVPFHARRDKA